MSSETAPQPYAPPRNFSAKAHVKSLAEYRRVYDESVRDPERFWAAVAQRLHWDTPFGRVLDWNHGAEATFGYRVHEAIGHDMADLIVPPALRPSHRRDVRPGLREAWPPSARLRPGARS